MPAADNSSPIDISPERFLLLYSRMAIISSLVILAVASYVIFSLGKHNMLNEAERSAIKISESLVDNEMDSIQFVERDGRRTLVVRPEALQPLDMRLRMFLQPFDIMKIKIYSAEKVIVYSTEAALIGKEDSRNARLMSALEGSPLSEIKHKQSMLDLYEEQKLEVDVVESYIPIFDTDKKVAGVIELYINIGKTKKSFLNSLFVSIGSLIMALMLVNGLYYLIIRKETELLRNTQLQLKQMAITDSLTGMYNRRYVIKRLEDEVAKMNRHKGKFYSGGIGCIMIDVDDFKLINDEHGHFTGDEVLCEIARRISLAVRQYDIPGRFGGEEFIVVLPNVSRAEAMPVAERIRAQINAEPFRVDGTVKNISVSMGVAWSEAKEGANIMEQILKLSDDGLYFAKESGKNMVVDMTSRQVKGQIQNECFDRDQLYQAGQLS